MSTSCRIFLFVLLGVPLLIAGCATLPTEPPPRPQQTRQAPSPPPRPAEPKAAEAPRPRTIASLKLTEQAKGRIEANDPDQAIRIIEKAIAIDPANGYNYYYLAEAWLAKGDRKQALEFNRMAGMYLGKEAGWLMKVKQQEERIRE